MKVVIDIQEHQYNNIMDFGSVNLGRVPYKGIIMCAINAIKHGKVLEQEPTTENDCAKQNGCITCSLDDGDDCCRKLYEESMQEPATKNDLALIHTEGLDEEIRCTMCTNSMKSDRGCDGSCVVNKDMYKAVMDAIEKRIQLTTKNDLGVDCISRADARSLICNIDIKHHMFGMSRKAFKELYNGMDNLPSVTPQPRKGHWKLVQRGKFVDVCCSNCEAVRIKEYAYNYTIDELNKEDINECFGSAEMRYCPNCGSRNEVEE